VDSGRDRLPYIVVPAMLVAFALAGVGVVYAVAKVPISFSSASHSDAPTSTRAATTVTQEVTRGPMYAGLTPDRAANFAAIDLAMLVGMGQSDDVQLATPDRRVSRTRCFHSGHWKPYWSVSFHGGSPIFESRRQALVFCNRNRNVIEVTDPIRH